MLHTLPPTTQLFQQLHPPFVQRALCVCVRVCVRVCVCVRMCVCMCVCARASACVYNNEAEPDVEGLIVVCVCARACVCVWRCVYTHLHLHEALVTKPDV